MITFSLKKIQKERRESSITREKEKVDPDIRKTNRLKNKDKT